MVRIQTRGMNVEIAIVERPPTTEKRNVEKSSDAIFRMIKKCTRLSADKKAKIQCLNRKKNTKDQRRNI